MNPIVFITGATAGIGRAVALLFAEKGYRLIINGRRRERLEELEKELRKLYKVDVLRLPFDVRQLQEVKRAINSLSGEWKNIDVLVNNAGLASGLSDIQDGDIEDWEVMIDTNIKGLLYVTREVSPLMVSRKKGHIVNIGSIAGKEVYPRGNVYCATKHAVDALNKGMRMDLLPHKIKVTSINPGMAETEFSIVRFKGDEQRASAVYKGLVPLNGKDVAEAVWFAVSRPEHVNINELIIVPAAQATARDVVRH